jgi:hypothetical protein
VAAGVELSVTLVVFMGLTDVSVRELQGMAQLSLHDPDVLDSLRGILGMRRAVVLLTFIDRQHWHGNGDDLRQIRQQAQAVLQASWCP